MCVYVCVCVCVCVCVYGVCAYRYNIVLYTNIYIIKTS